MTEPETRLFAWEPLTPSGVAAFAHATAGRLLLVQFVVALIVAVATVWFLYDGWCPTIREAIEKMPDQGQIRSGKLDWRGESPQLLAEGTLLAVSVDLEHSRDLRSPADVQFEFGKDTLRVRSLLGYVEVPYSDQWIIAFNRKDLIPWWGAWKPALLTICGVAVGGGLLLLWYALATIYTVPVWLFVLYANRELRLAECFRLAGAALMPGALLMAAGILLYDFGVVDLVGLSFVTGGHVLLGWIYLFVSPLFLPKNPASSTGRKNPFAVSDKK